MTLLLVLCVSWKTDAETSSCSNSKDSKVHSCQWRNSDYYAQVNLYVSHWIYSLLLKIPQL